jgi:hypothetical protein
MDMEETETGVDASDSPGEDPERMAHETSLHRMAPDTEASSEMVLTKRRLLPNTTAVRTNLARPY